MALSTWTFLCVSQNAFLQLVCSLRDPSKAHVWWFGLFSVFFCYSPLFFLMPTEDWRNQVIRPESVSRLASTGCFLVLLFCQLP